MPQTDDAAVAVELAQMRGAIDTGFAALNGRLDIALQRTAQTEKDLTQSEQRLSGDLAAVERRMVAELGKLDTRVTSLERSRWPLPAVGALTAVGALVIGLYQLFAQ